MSTPGCSNFPLGSLLGGKGTNVAANTQIGAENNQTLGVSNSYSAQTVDAPAARVEQSQGQINKITSEGAENIVYNENSPLMILLLVLGWLLPSPNEIANTVRRFISGVRG